MRTKITIDVHVEREGVGAEAVPGTAEWLVAKLATATVRVGQINMKPAVPAVLVTIDGKTEPVAQYKSPFYVESELCEFDSWPFVEDNVDSIRYAAFGATLTSGGRRVMLRLGKKCRTLLKLAIRRGDRKIGKFNLKLTPQA